MVGGDNSAHVTASLAFTESADPGISSSIMKKLELMEERIVATIQQEIEKIGHLLHSQHAKGSFKIVPEDFHDSSTGLAYTGRIIPFSDKPAGNAFTIKPSKLINETIDVQTGSTFQEEPQPTKSRQSSIRSSGLSPEVLENEESARRADSIQPSIPSPLPDREGEGSSAPTKPQLTAMPSRRGTLIAYEEYEAGDDEDEDEEDESQEKHSVLTRCLRTAARCHLGQECTRMFFGVRSFDKYSGTPGSRTIHPASSFMSGAPQPAAQRQAPVDRAGGRGQGRVQCALAAVHGNRFRGA
jgi:hypothetical protein